MSQATDAGAYRYQKDLPDAIDAMMLRIARSQPESMQYRGVDLSRLIGMELYYRLINDQGLRSAYDSFCAGQPVAKIVSSQPLSEVASWVFPFLVGQMTAQPPLGVRIRHFFRASRKVSRSAEPSVRDDKLARGKTARPTPGPVALLAISQRFYQYLLPIRQSLDMPVCWLVPAGANWSDAIRACGDAVQVIEAPSSESPRGQVSDGLRDWASTLQRFDACVEALNVVMPQSVVVVEGNHLEDEIAARAAESLRIPSVCIQQGWSPFIHTGFRRMRFDAFCVWGRDFAEMLRSYNPEQRFVVTGSHVIEPLQSKMNPSATAISFFLQRDHLVISEANWRRMVDFLDWCAKTWPEREILVREHPAIPFDADDFELVRTRPNVVFCPASEMSLDDVLDRSRISVAIFSTTLIESLARQVVPFVVNITGSPRYFPDLAGLGVAVEVRDYAEARTALRQLIDERIETLAARIPDVVGRFFSGGVPSSLGNISALIRETGVGTR